MVTQKTLSYRVESEKEGGREEDGEWVALGQPKSAAVVVLAVGAERVLLAVVARDLV